jgi:antitoxin component YwqK of YwqJK toxin-antitoxin module
MKVLKFVLVLLLAPFLFGQAQGTEDRRYLDYSWLLFPYDKYGPEKTSDGKEVYSYYVKGANIQDKNALLGREYFVGKTRVERQVFKDGKKHGIQKQWIWDGKPKSESPYKDGMRHGTFRVWNESNQLIGQFEMRHGTGILREYYPWGSLKWEKHYLNDKEDGPDFNFYGNGQAMSLMWYMEDKIKEGKRFDFQENGDLQGIRGSFNGEKLDSPYVHFECCFNPESLTLFLRAEKVDLPRYLEERKQDPSLPAIPEDLDGFKKMLTPEIQKLIRSYKDLPRVKIPLEMDKKGNPIAGAGISQECYEKGIIPLDLVKHETGFRSGCPGYSYCDPITSEEIVEEEMYWSGKQIKRRTFFKNGEKHGLESSWWTNGQLIAEASYNHNVLDGTFKRWDENGKLLDTFQMKNGTGIMKEYYPNGKIKDQRPLKLGQRDGVLVMYHDNGSILSFAHAVDGKLEGPAVSYFYHGNLSGITSSFSRKGKCHGIHVSFKSNGEDVAECRYYLNGEKVDPSRYEKETKADPSLPRYQQEPKMYRALEKDILSYYKEKGWEKK